MNRTVPLAVAAATLLMAGCGSQTAAGNGTPSSPATPTGSPQSEELYAEATVLESPDHGPELCLGGVMESLPPQCGGPALVGWDWDQAGAFARRSGVTWGSYVVVGSYDAEQDRFTLTRPAVPSEEYDGPRPSAEADPPLGTPCAEPEGGWEVLDPALATEEALGEVQRVAHRLTGFAGFWYDQSINPAYGSEDAAAEGLMNDPEKLVVNVAVTGDVADAEEALREVWGGSLCVSQAQNTMAELRRIQRELARLDGMLSVSAGQDRVSLTVVHVDGALQKQLFEKYGAGVVEVDSALQPYPG